LLADDHALPSAPNNHGDAAGGLPEDADALYAEGMAHYRRREWSQAKACFARLKTIAPDRRGVDALLNEIDIFVQLQEMRPEGEAAQIDERSLRTTLPVESGKSEAIGRDEPRRSPWPIIVFMVIVLIGLLVVLYATGTLSTILDNQRSARVQALVNQCRAAMNVGECGRAVTACDEALALAPNNDEIKTWSAKARRCQQLSSLYEEAELALTNGEWDDALQKLQEIAGLDPTYKDVQDQLELVESQKELGARLVQANDHVKERSWDLAISLLEKLRREDAGFKSEEVAQVLFDAHFGKGLELVASAHDSPEKLGQGILSLDSALQILPSDAKALEERQLAESYRQGYLSANQSDWPQAVSGLQAVYQLRPEYMGGRAASLLCLSYLRLGDAYRTAGDLEQALEQYRSVRGIEGCVDYYEEAAANEREVHAILYPPTPTSAPTSTPTVTLPPTPTATITPTWTLAPTSPPTQPPTSVRATPTPPR
jgi:tetratricopeptide (TPR) repeat protein